MLITLTTVPSSADGEVLAQKIVEAQLAACVQVLPQMMSVYVWKGEVQKEAEHLLLIKTLPEKWDELEKFVGENHPYEIPELVSIDTENVSEHYRTWMESVLAAPGTL